MTTEEFNREAALLRPVLVAVAAAAAVALVLCLTLYAGYHEDRALAHLYGGSYVIVDGKRIDDLSVIRGDIERTLTDARRIESRAEAGFIDGAERDVLMSIDDLTCGARWNKC